MTSVIANSAPTVSNVTASQRTDGSGIVDIYYTLNDADNDKCSVSIKVSDDGGSSWDVIATSFSSDSDIGENISSGNSRIAWNCKADLPGNYGANYRIKVTADDGISDVIPITWVYINDSDYTGHMSKYETSNAQYCQFLNASLTSSSITVYNDYVYAASDTSHSQPYLVIYPVDIYSQIIYSDGTFSVRSRDGYNMDNHPVIGVSWYGATGFCNYYGWRLPTEWEWQAVADYDESYIYGCGTLIDSNKSNYNNNNPLNMSSQPYTTPVDYFSFYGYGLCDMTGNVWEWTGSSYGSDRIVRGGSWANSAAFCSVSHRGATAPSERYHSVGFRVCR